MEAIALTTHTPPSPSKLLKRRLSTIDSAITPSSAVPLSPHSMDSNTTSNGAALDQCSRQASPAISITSSLTSISANGEPQPISGLDGTAESTARPAKRQKLTPAEKLEKQREKAEKDKVRELEKAKKDEEKLVKDEERRKKNEEKEEKRRQKEQKDQQKEEEKRKKQEELDKKEKSQSRLFSFLKPTTPSSSSTPPRTKSVPIATAADYSKTFFPFALPSNARCAPISWFSWDDAARKYLESTFDKTIQPDAMEVDVDLKKTLNLAPFETIQPRQRPSVRELVTRIAGSEQSTQASAEDAMTTIRSMPLKCIYYSTDVRPPYIGTYTKVSDNDGRRMARKPFHRLRTDTDYDYDSEAEWEEPEEGEDLLSDGDSDGESNAETDDMDGFLDDEGADGVSKSRFLLGGDLVPVSTGLCWENLEGLTLHSPTNMREFKLSLLLDNLSTPIDPFSEAYWVKEAAVVDTTEVDDVNMSSRRPLQSMLSPNGGTILSKPTPSLKTATSTPKAPNTPGNVLSGEELDKFKQEVEGSTVNKAALLGLLKHAFPKVKNNVLKDTLNSVAARVGKTEAEKTWRIV